MELGATVCTARQARCQICPVWQSCSTGRRRRPRLMKKAT
jgi:adenine-specific DNA glycosylase